MAVNGAVRDEIILCVILVHASAWLEGVGSASGCDRLDVCHVAERVGKQSARRCVALKSHVFRDFSVKWHHRSNTSRHDRGQPKLPVQNGIVVSRPPLMLHECRAGAANERERCV